MQFFFSDGFPKLTFTSNQVSIAKFLITACSEFKNFSFNYKRISSLLYASQYFFLPFTPDVVNYDNTSCMKMRLTNPLRCVWREVMFLVKTSCSSMCAMNNECCINILYITYTGNFWCIFFDLINEQVVLVMNENLEICLYFYFFFSFDGLP